MTGGRATGVEVEHVEGDVTIQILGPEPGLDLEGLRQPSIPTKRFEPETIFIPRGPFLMGSAPGPGVPEHETPQHEVDLPDYRIGKHPVTVDQYRAFLQDQRQQRAPPGWFNREPPPTAALDHPVANVSWHDAIAYCAWLDEQTERSYTLPSEAEWEKAASWSEEGKRRYPWGPEWVDDCCNADADGTTAVTAHAPGASAYGVEDLLGNVQEWTRSRWGRLTRMPKFEYDYDPGDGREVSDPERLSMQARLVHRGGSFKSTPDELSCTARKGALSYSRVPWRGFRVVIRIE
jgi:formylglycine-generating enzyme required for sulfatase activity